MRTNNTISVTLSLIKSALFFNIFHFTGRVMAPCSPDRPNLYLSRTPEQIENQLRFHNVYAGDSDDVAGAQFEMFSGEDRRTIYLSAGADLKTTKRFEFHFNIHEIDNLINAGEIHRFTRELSRYLLLNMDESVLTEQGKRLREMEIANSKNKSEIPVMGDIAKIIQRVDPVDRVTTSYVFTFNDGSTMEAVIPPNMVEGIGQGDHFTIHEGNIHLIKKQSIM